MQSYTRFMEAAFAKCTCLNRLVCQSHPQLQLPTLFAPTLSLCVSVYTSSYENRLRRATGEWAERVSTFGQSLSDRRKSLSFYQIIDCNANHGKILIKTLICWIFVRIWSSSSNILWRIVKYIALHRMRREKRRKTKQWKDNNEK